MLDDDAGREEADHSVLKLIIEDRSGERGPCPTGLLRSARPPRPWSARFVHPIDSWRVVSWLSRRRHPESGELLRWSRQASGFLRTLWLSRR